MLAQTITKYIYTLSLENWSMSMHVPELPVALNQSSRATDTNYISLLLRHQVRQSSSCSMHMAVFDYSLKPILYCKYFKVGLK